MDLLVRLNQEHGDRLWILGVYETGEDAAWWEGYRDRLERVAQDVATAK